jgi:hypothetical protein
MKNLSQSSLAIGKSEGYLRSLKDNTPLAFRTIKFLGKGDMVKGYFILQEKLEDINKKFEEIYFSYDVPYQFAKLLHENGLYSSVLVAQNTIRNFFGKTQTLKSAKAKKAIIRIHNKSKHIK